MADAEFQRQASILTALAKTIDLVSQQPFSPTDENSQLSTMLVPAGGQNTMAAAAVVLLAAHFEEYIRQQIEEYAKAVVQDYIYLDESFANKLTDQYWKFGVDRLGRLRPKNDPTWAKNAASLLNNILKYPVSQDISCFVSSIISQHDHNMRMDTVLQLSGRVGIKKLSEKMSSSKPLQAFFTSKNKSYVAIETGKKLNSFYDLRNTIVHSIAQSNGIGVSVFIEWASFLILFSSAFATALDVSFLEHTHSVEKRKTKFSEA